MVSRNMKALGKSLVVGASVLLLSPLLAPLVPAGLDIALVAGLSVGGLLAAAVSAMAGEWLSGQMF